MRRIFIAILVISAVGQFLLTRRRAGQTIFEGDAEAMWVRYPLNVLLNAALWSALALSVRGGARMVRNAR